MAKKCDICESESKYCVKGGIAYYCEECAKDNFSDLGLLKKVGEEVQALKNVIEEEINLFLQQFCYHQS